MATTATWEGKPARRKIAKGLGINHLLNLAAEEIENPVLSAVPIVVDKGLGVYDGYKAVSGIKTTIENLKNFRKAVPWQAALFLASHELGETIDEGLTAKGILPEKHTWKDVYRFYKYYGNKVYDKLFGSDKDKKELPPESAVGYTPDVNNVAYTLGYGI